MRGVRMSTELNATDLDRITQLLGRQEPEIVDKILQALQDPEVGIKIRHALNGGGRCGAVDSTARATSQTIIGQLNVAAVNNVAQVGDVSQGNILNLDDDPLVLNERVVKLTEYLGRIPSNKASRELAI